MYKNYRQIFNNCNDLTLDSSFIKKNNKDDTKNKEAKDSKDAKEKFEQEVRFNRVPLDKDPNLEKKYLYGGTDYNDVASYRYDEYNTFRGNYPQQDKARPFSNYLDKKVGNGILYMGGKSRSNVEEDFEDSVASEQSGEGFKKVVEKGANKNSKSCELDSDGNSLCGVDKDLDPILDPLFNLREVSKQMILLEDHLFQKKRRCTDCIRKHSLCIEGFLEEAITLDKEKKYYSKIQETIPAFKEIMKQVDKKMRDNKLTDDDCIKAAQDIRKLRKDLCSISYSSCY